MTAAERWSEVRARFEELRDLDAEAREAALERLSDDPVLARELRALLDADSRPRPLFERSAREQLFDDLGGTVVDGFHVEAAIGEGGTATVYRARAEDGTPVALKVLKPGLDRGSVVARFRRERATLEALDHPGVLRVRGAGRLPDGRPYLVTDWIDGLPIDEHCERNGLPRRARLEAFLAVCDAVHHAHRHLVVHRDLKPSNILVDSAGNPLVLDFGIAKLLDPELDPGWTDAGGRAPLTLAHASPEQVRGEPVTTATDVYSLGVLLHHMVTGRSPYRAGPADPPALEREIASGLRSDPIDAADDVGSDLATVLRCAMATEPGDRYASVEHLADDVRRVLERRPVRARPTTAARAVLSFVRRRPWVPVAAIVVAALLIGKWMGVRASERLAWRAHTNAVVAVDLLGDLLERAGDPAAGPELRTELDAAEQLLAGLDELPEAEARMRMALGRLEAKVGERSRAIAHFERALELTRSTRGLGWRDLDRCLDELDRLLAEGDPARALALARERVELHAERGSAESLDAARGRVAQLSHLLGRAHAE